jgi:putative chitinase
MTPIEGLMKAISIACPKLQAPQVSQWAEELLPNMRASGITTTKRVAMFIGQCAEESAYFTKLEEDLYYSSAARILEVWPLEFAGDTEGAQSLVGEPELLANRIYAPPRLGNVLEGDGWLFRGRGLLGLTGRNMYTDFSLALGRNTDEDIEQTAEWVATVAGAARSACWYWNFVYHDKLNTAADDWDVRGATEMIAGSLEGLTQRVMTCSMVLAAMADTQPQISSAHGRTFVPVEPTADDLNAQELSNLQRDQTT